MLKISGKNRGCLIVLNIPQLREKINKTCANRPVSCVNGEVRTEFGSPFGGNDDDRRQRRKQGGAVGAAASRMQATAKQTLGAATRPWRAKVTERARMLEGRLLLFRAGHGILEKKNPPTGQEKGETEI